MLEVDGTETGVGHFRGEGGGDGHGADGACHQAGASVLSLRCIRRAAGKGAGLQVHAPHEGCQLLVREHTVVIGLVVPRVCRRTVEEFVLADAGSGKGAGADDIRPGSQVIGVDFSENLRVGEHQHIVVVLQVLRVALTVCKQGASVVLFAQMVLLHHCAHGTIQQDDASFHLLLQMDQPLCRGAHRCQ